MGSPLQKAMDVSTESFIGFFVLSRGLQDEMCRIMVKYSRSSCVYISRVLSRDKDYRLGRASDNLLWVLLREEFMALDLLCAVATARVDSEIETF